MYNKTEQEIMKNWQGDVSRPVVSVCTITYNHENYIAEAIDSFLMQETNFPFEIVIGEDCSTDGTRKIIEKYLEKYPNIIKLITSENNVGMMQNLIRTMKACKGEYIAFCEGDDYWTDKKKLQIQIDEMKKHPMLNMSFHSAYELIDSKKGNVLCKHSNKTKIFTLSEVILGGGEYCPTASLVLKKEVIMNLPKWFYEEAPVGDYFLQIFGAQKGGALYIDKSMSIYRRFHSGSWTEEVKDPKKAKQWLEKSNTAMDKLNEYLKGNYKKEIFKIVIKCNYDFLKRQDIALSYRDEIYKKYQAYFELDKKIKWRLVISKPSVYNTLKKVYRTLKKIRNLIFKCAA